MAPEPARIAAAIEAALRLGNDVDDATIRDIAFHMTDWMDDLASLNRFYDDPGRLSRKDTLELLTRFLIHVPAHVAAASRLLMDDPVTDVFGIGAVLGDGRSHG